MKENFDLQLFAAVTNTTASAGLSDEMKEYYDKQLIRKADPYLVHNQFGQKRPIPRNNGKTIEFRTFSSLPKATTALTEGVTPDGQALEVENITATVSQYGDYVKITDMVDLAAVDPVLTETQELLSSQAGRTLDTITREVINAGTNVLYAGGAASRTALTQEDALALDDIFTAAAILKAANARPFEGGFVAIIHPYVAYDLMTQAKENGCWIDINKYTNVENIFNGELGKVAGVRFVESTEAKIWAGTEAQGAIFSTLVVGKDAYGVTEIEGGGLEMIVKPFGSGDDALNQRCTAGWKATATAEILSPEYMVRIESCSPKFGKKATAN